MNLLQLEELVEHGIFETGMALHEIHARALYASRYGCNFEIYVRERWGRTRQWAYQQMAAATVHLNLLDKPIAMTQAVTLAPLEPWAQREIAALVDFTKTNVEELQFIAREAKNTLNGGGKNVDIGAAVAYGRAAYAAYTQPKPKPVQAPAAPEPPPPPPDPSVTAAADQQAEEFTRTLRLTFPTGEVKRSGKGGFTVVIIGITSEEVHQLCRAVDEYRSVMERAA